jgi:acyl-CoA synthetase (AMP-forming)/AMP-acid ligase II
MVVFLTGNDATCWCTSVAAQAGGIVITYGFSVYTRKVTDTLAVPPAVSSAAVFGVPDDRLTSYQ